MSSSLSELLTQRVARFLDRTADWDAFADARVDGYRRARSTGSSEAARQGKLMRR